MHDFSQYFPPPRVFNAPPAEGVPLEMGNTGWLPETRMLGATRPITKINDFFVNLDTLH